MSVPAWNDPQLKAGTMVRGALWLLTEVGVGNAFTKEDLREAFPGVSQIDRRIRDLRKFGWIILASTEDAGLASDEQRFVSAGTDVWNASARQRLESSAITAKQRREVMAADGYQCAICGIAGGETYPDSALTSAVLSISRRPVTLPSGESKVSLVTECNRCRAGAEKPERVEMQRLFTHFDNLDAHDRRRLQRWLERGSRGPTPLDRVWTSFRRLPAETKNVFMAYVANHKQLND